MALSSTKALLCQTLLLVLIASSFLPSESAVQEDKSGYFLKFVAKEMKELGISGAPVVEREETLQNADALKNKELRWFLSTSDDKTHASFYVRLATEEKYYKFDVVPVASPDGKLYAAIRLLKSSMTDAKAKEAASQGTWLDLGLVQNFHALSLTVKNFDFKEYSDGFNCCSFIKSSLFSIGKYSDQAKAMLKAVMNNVQGKITGLTKNAASKLDFFLF